MVMDGKTLRDNLQLQGTSEQHSAHPVVTLSYCTNTVFILLLFILLHSFHSTQLFSARGAILFCIELAPLLEDEDDLVKNELVL